MIYEMLRDHIHDVRMNAYTVYFSLGVADNLV